MKQYRPILAIGYCDGLGVGKKIGEVKIVFSGAGAGSIASAKLLIDYGAKNVILVDSQGIVSRDRTDLNSTKTEMLAITNPNNTSGSLAQALQLADVFVGLSVGGIVTQDMVRSMSPGAAVFAAAAMPCVGKHMGVPTEEVCQMWMVFFLSFSVER